MVCRQTSVFWYTESWNFRISTAHAYKYKTKLQPKIKRRENKNDILLASHQSTYVPEKHSFAYRPYTSAENRNAVLICNTDNWATNLATLRSHSNSRHIFLIIIFPERTPGEFLFSLLFKFTFEKNQTFWFFTKQRLFWKILF